MRRRGTGRQESGSPSAAPRGARSDPSRQARGRHWRFRSEEPETPTDRAAGRVHQQQGFGPALSFFQPGPNRHLCDAASGAVPAEGGLPPGVKPEHARLRTVRLLRPASRYLSAPATGAAPVPAAAAAPTAAAAPAASAGASAVGRDSAPAEALFAQHSCACASPGPSCLHVADLAQRLRPASGASILAEYKGEGCTYTRTWP
mmetsp:Transcript_40066/g.55895  ORF Transcript_40066/g.55895 Transcript_40066/m.55895 type:complete len:203 (-) Transcript_40066:190-798(-)